MTDQEIFRQFERFCIEYDIAIDEEEYSYGWKEEIGLWPVEEFFSEASSKEKRIFYDFDFLERKISEVNDQLDDQITICWDDKKKWNAMKRLLVVKRTRAALQYINSTEALDSLDYLAAYLVKYLPKITQTVPDNFYEFKFQESQKRVVLHIMYINEVAACYRGFLSIGYADQCLELIKRIFKNKENEGKGFTPYELVALYSKAQGYLHARDHEKALEEFNKIIEKKEVAEYKYFDKNPQWCQWMKKEDEELFDKYIVIQAMLMKADVLIKLQRSGEAIDCLKPLNMSVEHPLEFKDIFFSDKYIDVFKKNNYKILRKEVLDNRANNDLKLFTKNKTWKQLEKELMTAQKNLSCKSGLKSQQLSIIIERWQQVCEKFCYMVENESEKKKEHLDNACKALSKCSILIGKQLVDAFGNNSETDQALLDWSKGLKLCVRILKSTINGKNIDYYIGVILKYLNIKTKSNNSDVVNNAYKIAISKEYRAHQKEIRQNLTYSIQDLIEEFDKNLFNKKAITTARRLRVYLLKLIKGILKNANITSFEKKNLIEWQIELEKSLDIHRDVLEKKDNLHKELRSLMAKEFFNGNSKEDPDTIDCPQGNVCNNEHKCISCDNFSERIKNNTSCLNTENGNLLHYYDQIIGFNRTEINNRLYTKSKKWETRSGWGFVVLKKWNSYTPALEASEGGGYFLYHTKQVNKDDSEIDLGIVIDPGYDYLKSFFQLGFTISDINAIIVSHDHPDHIDDFSKIVNLLFEVKKNRSGKQTKQPFSPITLGLSLGAYNRLKTLIESVRDVFADTKILKSSSLIVNANDNDTTKVLVKPTESIHKDGSENDSIGFKLELKDIEKTLCIIGLPCDTRWSQSIAEQYYECRLLCIHIGGIVPEGFKLRDYFDDIKTNKKVVSKKQHLYLPGALWFGKEIIDECDDENGNSNTKLLLLSEFGEELSGGLRTDFVEKLLSFYKKKNLSVIASDVGLVIDPVEKEIRCSCCHGSYQWSHSFKCYAYGPREQIFYICPTCQTVLSYDQQCRKLEENLRGKF